MERKTPQEKKALSYEKDRRNNYGESDKSSRKSIPLRKAKQNRGYRKNVNQILDAVRNEVDLEKIDLLESEARSMKKGDWKKHPDAPLGEVVKAKIDNRKAKTGKGKTARKKEREIVEKMSLTTCEQTQGVWIAEVLEFRGLKAKGKTEKEAVGKVKTLARIAARNAAGFNVKILMDGNFIKPVLEIK